jgi:hypothetical protein
LTFSSRCPVDSRNGPAIILHGSPLLYPFVIQTRAGVCFFMGTGPFTSGIEPMRVSIGPPTIENKDIRKRERKKKE